MLIERVHPLRRSGQDDGTPAALQDLFQDLRQRLFERASLEMIEADLGHGPSQKWPLIENSFPLLSATQKSADSRGKVGTHLLS
ncbi:hypothetical protein GCM10022293_59400 [Azospirillum formosense]